MTQYEIIQRRAMSHRHAISYRRAVWQRIETSKSVLVLTLLLSLVFSGCAQTLPPETKAFVDWVGTNAIEIENPDASLSKKGFKAFRKSVGSARVVGIGESRHDTREQLLLKSILVRQLVEDMGFRALIIEESYPHALLLHKYAMTGEGDLRTIVNGLAGWYLWDTEEMIELIEWIRQYNMNQVPGQKVGVYGMDITAPAPGVRSVLETIKVAGIQLDLNSPKLGLDLQEGDFWPTIWERYSGMSRDYCDELIENYKLLVEGVKNGRKAIISSTSEKEYRHTLMLAELGQSGNEFFVSNDRMAGGAIRERGMANAVFWILDNQMPEDKAIIWAHNLHVSKGTFRMPDVMEGILEPMGVRVKRELGDGYLAIGATFGKGSYPSNLPPGQRDFELLDAESMDGALACVGKRAFLFDLRLAEEQTLVIDWLNQERTWRAQDVHSTLVPYLAFDMVYYVENITRSQPTPLALQRYQSMRE